MLERSRIFRLINFFLNVTFGFSKETFWFFFVFWFSNETFLEYFRLTKSRDTSFSFFLCRYFQNFISIYQRGIEGGPRASTHKRHSS